MARRNEDFDEYCDPENPKKIKTGDVLEAAQRIKPFVMNTPCMAAHTQKDFGIYIHYKLELLQATGSFKERGALNALSMLPTDKKKLGIIIASTGNSAIAFAYHARKLSIPMTVVLPMAMPISLVQRLMALGAKIVVQGSTLWDANKHARTLAKEKGLTFINGRDHPHVLAGHGTIGLELLEQTPFADAILLPVGSGGLIAAVATVFKEKKPNCLIYGVQPETACTFFKSLEKDQPLSNMPLEDTLAGHALEVNSVGVNAFANAKSLIDKMLLVKDDWIARAMLHLVEREKFIVEGSGACPLAAIIGNLVPELKTKNVVCILSGGNIDNLIFNRSLERGLAAEGRLIKFRVGVLNLPGHKRDLMKLISSAGYNVITHFIDNIWSEGDNCYSDVRLVCETKGLDHSLELKRLIEQAYPKTSVFESEPFNDKRTCPCYVRKGLK